MKAFILTQTFSSMIIFRQFSDFLDDLLAVIERAQSQHLERNKKQCTVQVRGLKMTWRKKHLVAKTAHNKCFDTLKRRGVPSSHCTHRKKPSDWRERVKGKIKILFENQTHRLWGARSNRNRSNGLILTTIHYRINTLVCTVNFC